MCVAQIIDSRDVKAIGVLAKILLSVSLHPVCALIYRTVLRKALPMFGVRCGKGLSLFRNAVVLIHELVPHSFVGAGEFLHENLEEE